MEKLILFLVLLMSFQASAGVGCVESNPLWPKDLSAFMELMDCSSAELAIAQDRAVYLQGLSDVLVGTTVQWSGTVRWVRGERIAFNESFASIGPDMKAARVMYYSEPLESEEWQQISMGQVVGHTGKIRAVKADTLASTRPMLYVEVQGVRPTK